MWLELVIEVIVEVMTNEIRELVCDCVSYCFVYIAEDGIVTFCFHICCQMPYEAET
jgi:hypothetical protein